jgi:hypothetical protein
MHLSRWPLALCSTRHWLIALLSMIAISCLCAPGLPSTRAQGAMRKIHDIQGSNATSPFAGQTVMTAGIVTAIKSDGFFIQEPDATADADPNTSEAIFVFTASSLPTAVAVGNAVTVAGTVVEFKPAANPLSLPLTQISNPPIVILLTAGNELPEPLTITAAEASPSGSLDQLERFEAMRVRVSSFSSVVHHSSFRIHHFFFKASMVAAAPPYRASLRCAARVAGQGCKRDSCPSRMRSTRGHGAASLYFRPSRYNRCSAL